MATKAQAEGFAARIGKLGKKKETVTAALDVDGRPGVLVDFVALNAGTTNGYVFQCDTTYYIAGALNLGGSGNVLEPGTCIKMAKTNGASITITGSGAKLTTLSTHWDPAIITSVDDDTIGQTLPGSDGAPNSESYAHGLYFDYLSSGVLANINNLRISYAGHALRFRYGTNHVVSHAALISSSTGVYADHNDYCLRNVLIYDVNQAFYGGSSDTMRGEFVTLHKVNYLGYFGYPTLFFTNSLLVAVTNSFAYSGANNGSSSTPDGVFAPQVGAGRHYLATDGPNPHRNAGTTNVNADLLREIRKLTTYPPTFLTNSVLLDTTLRPRVQRDVDLPDRGWHATAVDYLARTLIVTNATLTLAPGVVIGVFGDTGIWLQDYSTLVSHGNPLPQQRVRILRYTSAQEISTNLANGSVSGNVSVNPYNYGNGPPSASFRFTDFHRTANNGYHVYGESAGFTFGSLSIRDCEFNSGSAVFGGPTNLTIALTNNFFHRAGCSFLYWPTIYAVNNLFKGGFVGPDKPEEPVWTFKGNSFHDVFIDDWGYETTNTHNAYINCNARLNPGTNPNDIVLSSFSYDEGPLSRWYQTTNSTLWNAAHLTNATLASMWHYGTRTNVTMIETNTVLDIGWHLLGSTVSGGIVSLRDQDGDGRWDAMEDIDGDGVFDAGTGETDWLNYDSILGVGSGPGLVVFTPLK